MFNTWKSVVWMNKVLLLVALLLFPKLTRIYCMVFILMSSIGYIKAFKNTG